MKKLYSILATAAIGAFGFMGYAQADIDGVYFVKGSYYHLAVQSDANPRAEAFALESGSYDGLYGQFSVSDADNPFNIKVVNESNSIYVYHNGVELENSRVGEMANMFDAQVTLTEGDVIKVYDAKPYVSHVSIGFMQPNSEVYGSVQMTMDCVIPVDDIYDSTIDVLEGTKFEIRATEGNKIANVYVCNEDVIPVDGVYTFTADREGDMLVIIDMAQSCEAQAMVCGTFYTFTAQSAANNRIEPLNIEYGTYNAQYTSFVFDPADNPFVLKGQNPTQTYYVYKNDAPVDNSDSGSLANIFDAEVVLAKDDILKIYDHEPFTTDIAINFKEDRAKVADMVEVLADGISPVDVAKDGCTVSALEGTRFMVRALDSNRISKVCVDGVEVAAVDGTYTITADKAGNMDILIDMASVEEGIFFIDGDFYTFTAQSIANNRVEPISVAYGEYDNVYRYFAFDPDQNPFVIKGMNGANTYYVYHNGKEVENSPIGEMANMFDADIEFAAGDVLKVYDHCPFVTNFNIGFMQPADDVADQVIITMDCITPIKGEATYKVLEGTKFEIRPAAGAQIANVYLNNEDIYPVDGVYTVTANQEGDMLLIIDMVEVCEAMAYVQGQFYHFAVQSVDNNRIEPLSVNYGTYQEYIPFSFSTANNPFSLKGQNEGNNFYVYINGEQISNSRRGEMANMFDAETSLLAGDVLKIYSKQPFVTDMAISFKQKAEDVCDKVSAVMDRITPLVDLGSTQVSNYTVLEGTEFQIRAKDDNKISNVYVDDVEIEAVDDVYTIVASKEGQMKVVIDVNFNTGISAIGVDNKVSNNNVYNMQGMLLIENADAQQIANLRAGMYIINGAKVIVR